MRGGRSRPLAATVRGTSAPRQPCRRRPARSPRRGRRRSRTCRPHWRCPARPPPPTARADENRCAATMRAPPCRPTGNADRYRAAHRAAQAPRAAPPPPRTRPARRAPGRARPRCAHGCNPPPVRAQFQWQRTSEGWEFDAERGGLRIGEREEGPPSEWRVVYRAADGAHALEVGYSRVRIEDALALARAAQALSEAEEARLAALAPRGELRDTYLRYQ